ncbi:cytochrome bd-I ubiquinol oxidase subunit 1 apoprotein [Malonomonas rubra DSM 5091]|uniref:Cytochrome bd-I ubiquinol oxidase subunit 1 apoprotein n=1 Tax=Malonomonas rubra DSM 5091 TaxID=1122189 RepID=A0A1M6IWL8_MALRU|nr:cytochrome ubiquinol oxidase subunit I [Malonomonas rubra]SHJ38828.1 cytochrome bd-I ubiquinol oxidase subunit 1 apoprotein [Malonomonas rubra DSM 5091]
MNYPVWDLTTYGGGFLIALIAIVHVLVSHFAVGGGLFLVTLEKKAYREENPALLDYVKKHSKFFMLLTMVFGGMTGVGIWWTIALLNPAATSSLIHIFVFGWAAEWVFFVGEIVALFIYYYTFGRMDRKNHLIIGWIYFICAWMSLFLINGIIDFMLTPGAWIENHNFWSGFFNPTFWPSLVFRTGLSLVLCGVFGFVTAAFLKNDKLRQNLMRTCAAWAALPFGIMLIGGAWYIKALPEIPKMIIFEKSPEIGAYLTTLGWFVPILLLTCVFMALRLPQSLQKYMSFAVIAIALIYFGAFEFVREAGRRPFIIYDHMYSNQVYVDDVPKIQQAGFLANAKWMSAKEITTDNQLQIGAELFRYQCSACHSVGGLLNDITPLVKKYDNVFGMDAKLNGLGKLNPYMPHFFGNAEERNALASYIVSEINGIDLSIPANPVVEAKELPLEIPAFNKDKDEYVLLAWNNLGMHCISDSDPYWVLLPPANDLFAQLVKRGDSPEIITEGVEIRYAVEKGFEFPEKQVRFWEFADEIFGAELRPGVGLSGKRLNGALDLDAEKRAYEASLIPVVPYPSDGSFNPYPIFTVTAVDKDSGEILATTKTVAPTSTEMGCKNCHGGGWRVAGVAGFTDDTSLDVLAAHDKNSGTNLVERAKNGQPMLCQSCHADPVLGTEGNPELLNFPAAIHGWHANFLTDREGMDACVACHPSRPDGPSQCFRSHHSMFMDCTNCHGTMEDHALSLLKKEQEAGKKGAARLMAGLKPRNVDSLEQINGRTPWINMPDCLNCHEDFQMGMTVDAFNTWTDGADELFRNRHDMMGAMMCEACHGSTHAVYPATNNKLGANRDSIQPLQYQGNDRPIGNPCTTCHTVQPEFEGHHPNSLRL